MTRIKTRMLSLLLALALVLGTPAAALAAVTEETLADTIADTARFLYQTVPAPQVGSVGGEWTVLGLARSGYDLPEEYYRDYYAGVEDYVRERGGVLHDKKYTEYSRLIVALAALGKDARDVAGYDLTKPLGDYGKTVWQGINGPIWALIALDCRDYPMPENPETGTQATRQMYLEDILARQLPGGGWNLTGKSSAGPDPDVTGMALQALAKYQDQPAVKEAVDKALACMSQAQSGDGGFTYGGVSNSESVVQMMVALCELGISLEDPRFVKNGNTLLDNLMTYYEPGSGFRHTDGGEGSDLMATEQGLYGLVAVRRAIRGGNSLYRMDDAPALAGGEAAGTGLAGKHPDVQAQPVILPGKTFSDISDGGGHPDREAIEALASRGILAGYTDQVFGPDDTVTRAQFAALVVRALGLSPGADNRFEDVEDSAWYAPAVGTAYAYGIVGGTSATTFSPNATITRQEAAVMVTRAAELCGMDTGMDAGAVRDVLAQFSDYVTVAPWARPGAAFCCRWGILDDSVLELQPQEAVKRCEVARMLFRLLDKAELL